MVNAKKLRGIIAENGKTQADVANMIVYLLSDAAKWITAQDYIIDCGVGL